MRIEQLEYLAAVTQHGSLRRASERLHLSQPALSESVTKLERELKVTLLDRRRTGARISREGRELLPYMEEVLAAVDRLRAAAGDQRADARLIRLGTVHAATATLLVPACVPSRGAGRRPRWRCSPSSRRRSTRASRRARSTSGWSTCSTATTPPAGLVGTDLLHGRPVAVLPADHPLAALVAGDRRGPSPPAVRDDARRAT